MSQPIPPPRRKMPFATVPLRPADDSSPTPLSVAAKPRTYSNPIPIAGSGSGCGGGCVPNAAELPSPPLISSASMPVLRSEILERRRAAKKFNVVRFNQSVAVCRTWLNEEYDRSPIVVERLVRADIYDLGKQSLGVFAVRQEAPTTDEFAFPNHEYFPLLLAVRYRGEMSRETKRLEEAREDEQASSASLSSSLSSSPRCASSLRDYHKSAFSSSSPVKASFRSTPSPTPDLSNYLASPSSKPCSPPASPPYALAPSPFPNGRVTIPVPLRPPPSLAPLAVPRRHSFTSYRNQTIASA
ncbi:hypothetical protein HDU90_001516 [Geranomyces variabilis]|nr:hypothetical protein HDU90_001516 [Geranomyces variabilis]